MRTESDSVNTEDNIGIKRVEIEDVQRLIEKGNLPQAEIYCRIALETEPSNPVFLFFLGLIADAVNLKKFAQKYLEAASRFAPAWDPPRALLAKMLQQLEEGETNVSSKSEGDWEKFLLIKAWGYGFWSDVSHVLGQLLIAEITGRIPMIHWGANSLFGDGTGKNAFDFYFEPVSGYVIDDLFQERYDFFPPKWNYKNLREENLNKFSGPYARMAGLYFLNRPEKVVISDFYTGIVDLLPWIPSYHGLYGLSIDELYRYLIKKYLHPRGEILDAIEEFYMRNLGSSDFISVHIRGSDKIVETGIIANIEEQYFKIIDEVISVHKGYRIFLMTDDLNFLNAFRKKYGDRIVTTDCQRTDSQTGIHYQSVVNRRRLGIEVMVDTYIAARGNVFIGLGWSNPAVIVFLLKDWKSEDIYLIGDNMYRCYNLFLHNW